MGMTPSERPLVRQVEDRPGLSRLSRGRKRRKKDEAKAATQALIVGLVLGAVFATLELQAPTSSQASPFLPLIFAAATLLIAAAVTDRARTGLLCGAAGTASQMLTLLIYIVYTYSITFGVALDVVISELPGVLAYPLAGTIGGYAVRRTV